MDRSAPPPSFSNLKLSLSAVFFLSALLAISLFFQRIANAPERQPGQIAPSLDMSSTSSPPDLDADQDGGSLANRLRLTREVLARVRAAAGQDLAVLVKMNTRDGFPGGMELDEAVQVAAALEQDDGQTLCLWDGYRTADDGTID